MNEELVWFGLAFSLAVAEALFYWFTQRRKHSLNVLSQRVVELILYTGVVVILLRLYSLYAMVSIDCSIKKLRELEGNLYKAYSGALQLLFGSAVVDSIISLAATLGTPEATIALEYFDLFRHTVLAQLEYLSVQTGAAWLITSLTGFLIDSLRNLRNITRTIILLSLVPKIRKFALPTSVILLAFSLALPYTISEAESIPTSMPPFVAMTSPTGTLRLKVKDFSDTPTLDTILIGLRDTNSTLFVVKGKNGDQLVLPTGNYTVLWIINYWTNFTLHPCCYEKSPYSYCNCYAYPAKFSLKPNQTLELNVWLPIYLITSEKGTMGHVVAYEGVVPLRPSRNENGTVEFALEPSTSVKEFFIRGGDFQLVYLNESLISKNGTCWTLYYRVTNEMPPGVIADLRALDSWKKSYDDWVERIRNAIPEFLSDKLVLKDEVPNFREYGIKIWFGKKNCSGVFSGNVSSPKIIIHGIGYWNHSSAPAYLSLWQKVSHIDGWLKENFNSFIYPLLALYKSFLLVFIMFSGILLTVGYYSVAIFSPISIHFSSLKHSTHFSFVSLAKKLKRLRSLNSTVIKIDWRPSTLYMELVLSREVEKDHPVVTTGRIYKRIIRESPKYLSHKPLPAILRFTSATLMNLGDFARQHYKESKARKLYMFASKAEKASRFADQSLPVASVNAIRYLRRESRYLAKRLQSRLEDSYYNLRLYLMGYDTRLKRMRDDNDQVLQVYFPGIYRDFLERYKEQATKHLEEVRKSLEKSGENTQIIDKVIDKVRKASSLREVDGALSSLSLDPKSFEILARKLRVPLSFFADRDVKRMLRLKALDILEREERIEVAGLRRFYLGEGGFDSLEGLWKRIRRKFGE